MDKIYARDSRSLILQAKRLIKRHCTHGIPNLPGDISGKRDQGIENFDLKLNIALDVIPLQHTKHSLSCIGDSAKSNTTSD